MYNVSQAEIDILRQLATKQMTFAQSKENLEKVALWKKHNAYQGERPMLHVEIGTFAQEVIQPMMKCQHPAARAVEYDLLHSFTNLELFGDDKVVPPYFAVSWRTHFNLFGYVIDTVKPKDSEDAVGHQFNHVIGDLEQDFHKLGRSTFGVDREGTLAYFDFVEKTFGDILPVKMSMGCLYAVPTQKIIHLMGMNSFYFALLDYPELMSQMMDRIAEDYLEYFRFLETEKLLFPTTGFENLGQGSWCFTDELPSAGEMTTKTVWGFMDSQESVGISPENFSEFIMPCYRKIAEQYGLLSYGCCEPVDTFWNDLKTLSNLRKVSISPWCNEEFMGNELAGKNIVYHRKPSPNYIGVDRHMNIPEVTEHINKTLRAAQGCTLEITQRDVYTVHSDVQKVKDYVELMHRCIDQNWK